MTDSPFSRSMMTHSFGERMHYARVTDELSRSGRLLRGLFAIALLALVVLFAGFILFVGTLDRSETEPLAKADAIVVLTGGSDRIPDAVQLLAEGHGARLLISGVNPNISPERLARMSPDHQDLYACCIDLDYGAGNTVGNATETRRWARLHHAKSIILVTSNYHMPRALIEFRRAMPNVAVIPRPVVPYAFEASQWWMEPQTARVLMGEYVKFLAAWGRSMASPVINEELDSTGSIKRVAFAY
jgi:uncharacterized SAM-binding protein YcdF (DUF218 family)